MIRFFTSIGGFLLGSLLFAFLMIIAFNPNFFAEKALKDFAKDLATPATNSLDKFLGATDMAKLKAFSAATEGLVSGQMLAQLQVQTAEAARTGRPIIIQSSTNTNVNNSSSAVLAGSPISTEDSASTSKMG